MKLNPKARKCTSRLVGHTMKHTRTKRDIIEEASMAEALDAEREWRSTPRTLRNDR